MAGRMGYNTERGAVTQYYERPSASAATLKNTGVGLNIRGMSGGACHGKSIQTAKL